MAGAGDRYARSLLFYYVTELASHLTRLHDAGLVRLRGEQQWSLTAEGTLALILGVRAGLCAAPDWGRVSSVTGQDLVHGLVRELCRGKAGEIPAFFSPGDLLTLLDTADAHLLLAGSMRRPRRP